MATGESGSAASLADSIGWLIIMLGVAIWKPWWDGAWHGLLSHAAVVADHRVEAATGVSILGGVVGLKGGWDASLVLLDCKSIISKVQILLSFDYMTADLDQMMF